MLSAVHGLRKKQLKHETGGQKMLNIIKLVVLVYLTIMGLLTTFGVVWLQCGLQITRDAFALLVFLSSVVGILYVLWLVR